MKHLNTIFLISICLIAQVSLSAQDSQRNELAGKMHQYLTQLEKQGFNGSVLAASQGKVIHKSGYGYSDIEGENRNTSSTIFDIGSITKQFTAAAILKLEMLGKLNTSDLITEYFDQVPIDKKSITIHHLLTHSAGFPGAIGNDYNEISNNDFINQAMQVKIPFEIGEGYRYSNVGYSLLVLIIEQVSGQSYEEFLHENLFTPAGMKWTGYLIPKWNENNIAIGYRGKKEWGRPTEKKWASDGPYLHLKGNGGILSTVEDMYKWHLALLGNNILDDAAKTKMYTRHIEEGQGAGSYYGYGWAIFPTLRNTELIAHNGGNGVFFADFWRYLDEKITVIMMTNSASRKYERIPSNLAKMIREKDFMPPSSSDGAILTNEEDIKSLVEHTFKTITKGSKSDFSNFLDTYCTQDFKAMVPLETHFEMLGQIKKELSGGQLVGVDIDGEQVIMRIDREIGPIEMHMGVIPEGSGKYKIAGILLEE